MAQTVIWCQRNDHLRNTGFPSSKAHRLASATLAPGVPLNNNKEWP